MTSGAHGVVHGHLSRIMQALERSPAVCYILDSQFRIIYCNPAWNHFARSNGAPQLTANTVRGFDLFGAIPSALRPAYSDAFQHVLRTGRVWEQSYECSSPTLFRKFRMRIHLLRPKNWFVVTNTLMVEQPHTRTATCDPNVYVDANGLITICAHCRCARRANSDQWDFVPDYLRLGADSQVKPNHGLCPVCRAYLYRFD